MEVHLGMRRRHRPRPDAANMPRNGVGLPRAYLYRVGTDGGSVGGDCRGEPQPREAGTTLHARRPISQARSKSGTWRTVDAGSVSGDARGVCEEARTVMAVGFGLRMQAKNLFFDRAMVRREVGKWNAAALSKAGSFIRRRARSSLRRRKKPSAPGTPPSVHSSSAVATLKAILFAYDRANMSVVVGPIRLNQKHFLGPQLISGTVPSTHEFGGEVGIREKLENIAPQVNASRRKGGPRRALTERQKQAMIARKGTSAQTYIAGTKWIRQGRRKPLQGQPVRVRLANYPARPFMGPALAAEAPNFPSLWSSSARVVA